MVGTDSCTRRISPLTKIDSSAPVLVAYKVDDSYVYLQNANNRASSTAFAISDWDDANGNWILRLYGYKIA